jgi:hypothetical protein
MRFVALMSLVAVAACSSGVPRGASPSPGGFGPARGPVRAGVGAVITDDGVDVVPIVVGNSMIGPRRADVPATREEVYDRIAKAFAARYQVRINNRAKKLEAERKLGNSWLNVLSIEFTEAPNEQTRIAVRGWSEVRGTQGQADRFDLSLHSDFEDVFKTVSCEIAQWQKCSN